MRARDLSIEPRLLHREGVRGPLGSNPRTADGDHQRAEAKRVSGHIAFLSGPYKTIGDIGHRQRRLESTLSARRGRDPLAALTSPGNGRFWWVPSCATTGLSPARDALPDDLSEADNGELAVDRRDTRPASQLGHERSAGRSCPFAYCTGGKEDEHGGLDLGCDRVLVTGHARGTCLVVQSEAQEPLAAPAGQTARVAGLPPVPDARMEANGAGSVPGGGRWHFGRWQIQPLCCSRGCAAQSCSGHLKFAPLIEGLALLSPESVQDDPRSH